MSTGVTVKLIISRPGCLEHDPETKRVTDEEIKEILGDNVTINHETEKDMRGASDVVTISGITEDADKKLLKLYALSTSEGRCHIMEHPTSPHFVPGQLTAGRRRKTRGRKTRGRKTRHRRRTSRR